MATLKMVPRYKVTGNAYGLGKVYARGPFNMADAVRRERPYLSRLATLSNGRDGMSTAAMVAAFREGIRDVRQSYALRRRVWRHIDADGRRAARMVQRPVLRRATSRNTFLVASADSLIGDGAPVLLFASVGASATNGKTGAMSQTYILRADADPCAAAFWFESDVSVCGQCPHRPALGASCYVQLNTRILAIWREWRAGIIVDASPADIARLTAHKLRLGSYGDPTAFDLQTVWRPLIDASPSHTGYTHQHADVRFSEWRRYVMASADGPIDRIAAWAAGWRTFSALVDGEARPEGAAQCPAAEEAGRRRTCETCNACSGNPNGRGASIVLDVHGAKLPTFSKVDNYKIWRDVRDAEQAAALADAA